MMIDTETGRILIVDDEEQLCTFLTRILDEEGLASQFVTSAQEALTVLSNEDIALMLLDVDMPGMNGRQLQEIVNRQYPDVAIIMVSGVDDKKTVFEALAKGAYGYIIKPVSPMDLMINVRNVLRISGLEQENRKYEIELENILDERSAELRKVYNDLGSTREQLLHQEKLATIGHLAAGIAHEIKNPTGYVGSNMKSMKKHLNKILEFIERVDTVLAALPVEARDEIGQAKKQFKLDFVMEDSLNIVDENLEGVERIKKIVEGLKSFSRKEQSRPRQADINECLENALTVAWNELKYKATVEKKYGDIPMVECFPSQIGQVFMNLLVNAAHAIKDQGVIKVSTSTDGESVVVSIADTGSGIPDSLQETIFEPFFTTKEDGVGTGLGLSIIKDIVERHSGEIKLESEEGKGSIFRVRIPITQN